MVLAAAEVLAVPLKLKAALQRWSACKALRFNMLKEELSPYYDIATVPWVEIMEL